MLSLGRREVDLLFLGLLVVPMLLYQAWSVYRWWRREKERKRELERALRWDMEEILRHAIAEKVPDWFRREMMKEIPVEHGGLFEEVCKQEVPDGKSQEEAAEAPEGGVPHVQAAEGRAPGQAEPEEPGSERPAKNAASARGG